MGGCDFCCFEDGTPKYGDGAVGRFYAFGGEYLNCCGVDGVFSLNREDIPPQPTTYEERMYRALYERFGTTDTSTINSLGSKGNFGGTNTKRYSTYIAEMECPDLPFSDFCLCGHRIKENHVVHHRASNRTAVVGSCCIKRFEITPSRVCTACSATHMRWKSALCVPCETKAALLEEARALEEEGREILTWGKYAGRTFDEAYADTIHFQFLDALHKEKKLKGNQPDWVRWGRRVCAGGTKWSRVSVFKV